MAEFTKIMEIRKRMCDSRNGCSRCPLASCLNGRQISCSDFMSRCPKEAEEIILQWDKEHPVKTRLTDFLEKYPKAKLQEPGVPNACAKALGLCDTCGNDCPKCWNTPLEE